MSSPTLQSGIETITHDLDILQADLSQKMVVDIQGVEGTQEREKIGTKIQTIANNFAQTIKLAKNEDELEKLISLNKKIVETNVKIHEVDGIIDQANSSMRPNWWHKI